MANYTKATDFASKDALIPGDPNKIVKGAEIDDEFSNIQTAVNSKADLLSPTLTGTPLAPTAVAGTNTTQIATTAHVYAERTNTATLTGKTINLSNNTLVATSAQLQAAVTDETGSGSLVFATSPTLSGTPVAPTASFGTNTTQVATTAFVQAALSALYPVGTIYTSTVATNPASTFGFGTWEAFGAGKVLVGQDTGDSSFDTLGEVGGSKDAIVVAHTHTVSASGTTAGDGSHSHTFSGTSSSVGDHTHTINNAGSHTHGITQWTGSADDSQDTGGTYTGMTTSLPFTAYPAGVVISTAGDHSHSMNGAGSHSHTYSGTTSTASTHTHTVTVTGTAASTGSSGTNANLQPYVVVKMWKRTA